MDYYIDIKLKSDAEMPINRLMNTLYSKLHKRLCDLKSNAIGISFPTYHLLLGDVLRIHGSNNDLEKLRSDDWIGGLIGYCQITDPSSVPNNCKFRNLSRIQPKMTQSKLNRLIKRGSITNEEAKEYKSKMFTKGLDQPYLELVSGSNNHKHRRYISFSNIMEYSKNGLFDQFGLSKTATVPWF